MSSSTSLLQMLFDKFWRALNLYKNRNISSRYEKIYPGYSNNGINIVGNAPQFNHLGYIPLISVTQLLHINYRWENFFNINNMNEYLNTRRNELQLAQSISLKVPVDEVIGKAIHERLSSHQIQNPRPYRHQADAITLALATLDTYRQELRKGNWPLANRPYDALAILADTASGKTEIFESIALQLILDSKNLKNYSNDNVKVIIIYPMKSLMIDHLRRLIRDIYYINNDPINQRSGRVITLGILTGDTPTLRNLNLTQKGRLHKEAEEWLNSITTCPFDGTPLKVRVSQVSEFSSTIYFSEVECSNPTTPHRFNFLRIHREVIYQNPPDILVITPDFLNRILYFYRGFSRSNVLPRLFKHGPPLLIVLDEPHMYTGTFGTNVSLMLREFENIMKIKFGLNDYRPFYILTSATMPNAKEFLARLLVTDPDRIYELSNFSPQGGNYQHNVGIVALLPTSDYGIRNAIVEVPLVVASILDRNSRKVLVFVDSVERAEQLRHQIEDYKNRRFPQEYQVCQNSTIYASDICPNGEYNPDFVEIRAIHARLDPKSRGEVEAELRKPDRPMILITTPALEIGIDVEDVSAVILAGVPPTPTSFRQRIGRTGRRFHKPGMVIMIGDETRGVDQYYLMDQNQLTQYLQLVRQYYLPLQPANPLYIRARLGNYLGEYAQISKDTDLRKEKVRTSILNNYEELSINSIINTFSNAQYETLKNISKMTSILHSRVKNDLRIIIDCLKNHNYNDIMKIYMQNVSVLRGMIKNCVQMYIPFIVQDLRSPAFSIKLKFPKILGIDDIEEDIKVALVTRSIAYIVQENMHDDKIDMSHCYRGSSKMIRGTIHPRSISLGGRNVQLLFEVCGIKGMMLSGNIDNTIGKCRNDLDFMTKNIDNNIDSQLQNIQNIFIRRLNTITKTLDEWLKHVKYIKQGSPVPIVYLPFILPEVFYLDLVIPNYIFIKNRITGHSGYYYVRNHSDLNRILRNYFNSQLKIQNLKMNIEIVNLPYLEWSDKGFVNKLQDISNGKKINSIVYDDKNYDLIFDIGGNKISYKMSTNKTLCEVRNDIRTYPRTFTCVNLDKSIMLLEPKTDNLGVFEITYLDDVEVWIMNQGFLIRKPDKGIMPFVRHSYLKRIGSAESNWFLGYNYTTKALKISIHWTNIISNLSNLIDNISNIYNKNLGYTPQKYLEDFKIRVSHTLSHIIINFHPIFTGAHSWDVSEYLIFESQKYNIEKSHIIIFDFDEGGNGVTEIIFYKLGDILSEALKTIEERRKRRVPPPFNFIGEPGDVLFGRWPICPYGNQGLSRELLYAFFVLLTGGNTSAVSKLFT